MATLSSQLTALMDGAHVMGGSGLAAYHDARKVKSALLKKDLGSKFLAIRQALKNYNVMVSLRDDAIRIYRPDTGQELVLGSKRNPMTDRVTLTETYKTGKGAGIIVAESGKVRGPYRITVVVGDSRKGFAAPKSRKIAKLGEARAALRGKLGPLRKAANPDEVVRLTLGDGDSASVGITERETPTPQEVRRGNARNPLNKYYLQRGDGGLILYRGRPYWTGSRQTAVAKAKQLARKSDVGVTVYRVEPDGYQEAVETVGGHGGGMGSLAPRVANPKSSQDYKTIGAALADKWKEAQRNEDWESAEFWSGKMSALSVAEKNGWPFAVPDGLLKGGISMRVNPSSQRNPAPMADADRLYQDFHGRVPTQTTKVITRTRARTDLAELGPVTELKVHLLTGKRHKLPYDPDNCDTGDGPLMLCSSPDGRQLYFVGGSQYVDLRTLGMSGRKWEKDSMVLGVLEMVTYRTEKGFDKFKLTDYYHELGEESGMQPLLVYDNINGLLSVAGGQYEVRPEGIVN